MHRIFVVGCPRSGTTLLQALLSQQPGLTTLPETHFFTEVRRKGRLRILDHLRLSPARADGAMTFLASILPKDGGYLPLPAAPTALGNATRLFFDLMDQGARFQGKTGWLEKSGEHIFAQAVVQSHFPEVPFVHIIRDGRDVLASIRDAHLRFPEKWPARSFGTADKLAFVYNNYIARTYRLAKTDARQLHIFFGDLVDNPQAAVSSIFSKLDMPDITLQVNDTDLGSGGHVRPDEGWKACQKKGVFKPKPLAKFRKLFDPEEQAYIEEHIPAVEDIRAKLASHPGTINLSAA
jgi:hypothetical protein